MSVDATRKQPNYASIVKGTLQGTTAALPLHYNHVRFPLPTVTEASESWLQPTAECQATETVVEEPG